MSFKQGQKIILVRDSMDMLASWEEMPICGTLVFPYPQNIDSESIIIKTESDSIWCQINDIVPDNKFFRRLHKIE